MQYRRNADEPLRRLERSLADDPSVLPQYIWNYLRTHGQPPPVAVPEILYFCETHRQQCGPGTNHPICPQTVWQSGPPPGLGRYIPSDLPCQVVMILGNMDNWINWIPHKNNLFQVKRTYFPEPTTPELLLAQFEALHHDHPAFMLLGRQVMSYMTHQLSTAVEIIAALRILPSVETSRYPTRTNVYTWDELAKAANLRTDLIRNRGYARLAPGGTLADHPPHERMYSRSLGFCIENMSPTSILTFGVVLESGVGARRELFLSNLHGGITMETRHYGENKGSLEPLPVELSWFG